MTKIPTAPGKMRARVRFDAMEPMGEDPGGGYVMGWVAKCTRWAEIRPLQGREEVLAQRLQGVQPVLIIVRLDDVTQTIRTDWRAVELKGETVVATYALKTACDMERGGAFMTMMAEAGAPDA
jgi:head-tail adaptor